MHVGKCTCGVSELVIKKVEKEQIYKFLMGLYDAFNTVKTQILSTRPLPSLGATYHSVAEDEQQRLISSSRRQSVDGAAFKFNAKEARNVEI